jgi:hypothetical protein
VAKQTLKCAKNHNFTRNTRLRYEWESPQVLKSQPLPSPNAPARQKVCYFGDYPEFTKSKGLHWNATFFVDNCATTSHGKLKVKVRSNSNFELLL